MKLEKKNREKLSKKKNDSRDGDKSETVQVSQNQQAQQSKKMIVRASKKNGYYYIPTHPSYNNVAAKNLLVFNSEEEAQRAGYKRAV